MVSNTSVGGGGLLGHDTFASSETQFIAVWIATFIFFILWLLSLFLLPVIEALASKAHEESVEERESETVPPASASTMTRSSRDAFLILLATTLANQSGHGHTYYTLSITWASFSLLVVWIFVRMLIPEAARFMWWLDMLVFFPVLALQIANFGLAFSNAPSMR
ncbi:hypothetical protein BATDEDRAFT_26947 [Batrachochytrium dendrobatidis JAM81]|uniref:Uncharacterized protein n=2 Tax=Batrachochytrium dendrobatidis TaxID=109871 RepID=F4P9L9_BATDJ|nr:uncharacterized protein BATDEDRAFT_26947 [Batrachochytrium dendrobatidis JAM81]EGF78341.1 hypothetical protein BATDEDRAFT_26947 [Batrachochytrium dendrobatidis JAM81]OAJ44465.1 hypothetical protein BDEG_27690 [Batrachochytrium dendrobatidis JEL423]|eukprot:XP_006681099.1 hypothetical protein BATDEDRAFT_26947 [Batrachochytrium dendrobatidis JAM81]